MGSLAKKPLSVWLIGWLFIIIAGQMILSGSLNLLYPGSAASAEQEEMVYLQNSMPSIFGRVLEYYNDNFYWFAILQVLFSAFMLICGIMFIRLYAWARSALEIMASLGLGYVIGVTVFYISSWISLIRKPGIEGMNSGFVTVMVLGAVAGMTVWAILLAVIIKHLRGQTIRKAVNRHAAGR